MSGALQPASPAQAREVRRVTVWGLVCNLGLCALKGVVGLLGGSQALVADAVHSLSDSVTDVAVLVGVRFWTAPADADHPHGHGRIETLVSFFIGLALAAVGVGLGYRAVLTLHQQHPTVPGWSAFAAAVVSLCVKEWLYWWTVRVGQRAGSPALIANAWHHRSDALSSVPVAVAVAGNHIQPEWVFLDHMAAMLVSVLVAKAAWDIAWPALRELTDAGAAEEKRRAIETLVSRTEGVREVHALRTRYIGPGLHVDLHVLVDPNLSVRDGHAIATTVKERLKDHDPAVVDVLVHIEPHEPGQTRL